MPSPILRAGSHAQTTNLGRSSIAHVVAVEIERGDHIIIGRAREQLLQHIVGNHIFDDDSLPVLGFFITCQGPPSNGSAPNSSRANS